MTPNAVQAVCGVKRTDPTALCDEDAFVVVLNSDPTDITYATYLGGDAVDKGRDIAVDAQGNISVAGTTRSQDCPLQNAQQASCHSGIAGGECWSQEVFVAKINAATGAFEYSTFLGGTEQGQDDSGYGHDAPHGIAMDGVGNVYVAGFTASHQFPLKDALQSDQGGGGCDLGLGQGHFCYDLFITQFAPNGMIAFSTYLGGTRDDIAYALARDGAGTLYLTGFSRSDGFPTTGDALQPEPSNPSENKDDAIVIKSCTCRSWCGNVACAVTQATAHWL